MKRLVGFAALVFSTLYCLSDVIEAIQGGFSDPQLLLTLVAEAAIPVFVIGLYAVQRPRIGRLGLVSAVAGAQVVAAGIRDLASAGMGLALLRAQPGPTQPVPGSPSG